MKRESLRFLACPLCEGTLLAAQAAEDEITSGVLTCRACGASYEVQHGIPCLVGDRSLLDSPTSELYSDIWKSYDRPTRSAKAAAKGYDAPARSHLELLRLASGRDLVQGERGIDAGCGPGTSTLETASLNPGTQVVGIDLSAGVLRSAEAARRLPNAHLVRGDLLHPPLARNAFDFAYSFGVLHHTPDPERAFRLLLERLRPGGRITVFLYKDFSDIPLKRALLVPVTLVRRVTRRMPPWALRRIAWALAPLVFVLLTWPARLLRRLGANRFAQHIPYGTFPHLTSIASSLQDRFGATYEFRFSTSELEGWAKRAGLQDYDVVDCLPYGFSGLVLAGVKPGT